MYYFPPEDVRDEFLEPTDQHTRCPYKGEASYWTIRVGDRVSENSMWGYLDPLPDREDIRGYRALYWNRMDAWYEEDEQVFKHPRDPYHRVDVLQSSRNVRVEIGGQTVAESSQPSLLVRDRTADPLLPARRRRPHGPARADRDVVGVSVQGDRVVLEIEGRRLRPRRGLVVPGPDCRVSEDPRFDRVFQRAGGRPVRRRRVARQTQDASEASSRRHSMALRTLPPFSSTSTARSSFRRTQTPAPVVSRALHGAVDVLKLLRARGTRYACFTNGTGQTPGLIAAKLRGLGLDVQDSEMLTPASVAAEYLVSTYPGEPVLAFGTDGLFEPLASAVVRLATLDHAQEARAVLIGAEPDFTYSKLDRGVPRGVGRRTHARDLDGAPLRLERRPTTEYLRRDRRPGSVT